MKKRCIILFLMLILLLTGCGKEDEESTQDIQSIVPRETVSAESEPEKRLNTVLLKQSDTLRVDYVLTALNPYAQYGPETPAINTQGADALARWFQTENALKKMGDFEDGLFCLPEEQTVYTGWIGDANDYTRTVRLMLTEEIHSVGLLEKNLPLFEAEYGYTVEIVTVEEGQAYMAAALGTADLILAPAPQEGELMADANYFRQIPGFLTKHIPLFYCPYVLCGPADDPAGTADYGDIEGAFTAIARAECYFISRGDYSQTHLAERQLWQTIPEGEWYFCANTAMGPCLTIAEEMGGYVLSDKLTWWEYERLNGII